MKKMLCLLVLFLFLSTNLAEALSITNITGTATSSGAVIAWKTDEPATGVVRYGTAVPPENGASHFGQTTDHSVQLFGLSSGQSYVCSVESTGASGTAVDSNSGAYYQIKTADI